MSPRVSRESRWLEAFDEATRAATQYGRVEAALVLMDAADSEQQRLVETIQRLREDQP